MHWVGPHPRHLSIYRLLNMKGPIVIASFLSVLFVVLQTGLARPVPVATPSIRAYEVGRFVDGGSSTDVEFFIRRGPREDEEEAAKKRRFVNRRMVMVNGSPFSATIKGKERDTSEPWQPPHSPGDSHGPEASSSSHTPLQPGRLETPPGPHPAGGASSVSPAPRRPLPPLPVPAAAGPPQRIVPMGPRSQGSAPHVYPSAWQRAAIAINAARRMSPHGPAQPSTPHHTPPHEPAQPHTPHHTTSHALGQPSTHHQGQNPPHASGNSAHHAPGPRPMGPRVRTHEPRK